MGHNDYFDAQERDAWAALRDDQIDKRRKYATAPLSDAAKLDMIRDALCDRISNSGNYRVRRDGASPLALLREILFLVTDGTMGDTWQGESE